MTRYADLSPYQFLPDSVPDGVQALTVGWLEPGDDHPRGAVPAEFVQALAELCRDDAHARTRGWHSCGLDHPEGAAPYPIRVQVGAEDIALGSAEVRVVDRAGRWLVAPNLVLHYVTAHGYLPPADFIEAVTARRSAPRTA